MKLVKFKEYESEENKFTTEQSFKYLGNDYWDWEVWIKGSTNDLDKIKYVVYNLHSTFIEPVVVITDRKTNFKLESAGWGTFIIYIEINFKNKTVLELEHKLVLKFPNGEVN